MQQNRQNADQPSKTDVPGTIASVPMVKAHLSIPTWFLLYEERKVMKRPCKINDYEDMQRKIAKPKTINKDIVFYADVYPQLEKQEEDNMEPMRLKNGYIPKPIPVEHESFVYHQKKLCIEKLDNGFALAKQYLYQVNSRRYDGCAGIQERERKRAKESCSYLVAPSLRVDQGLWETFCRDRIKFMCDVMRGGQIQSAVKKPQTWIFKEDLLEWLWAFKMDHWRAWLLLKQWACISLYATPNSSKAKKTIIDTIPTEYQFLLATEIRDLLYDIAVVDVDPEKNEEKRRKLQYLCYLAKHGFEEGALDRQEFLTSLCNIFTEIFIMRKYGRPDTWQQFQLFLMFFTGFTDRYARNYLLARRAAYCICQKLKMIKEEWEDDEPFTPMSEAAPNLEEQAPHGNGGEDGYYNQDRRYSDEDNISLLSIPDMDFDDAFELEALEKEPLLSVEDSEPPRPMTPTPPPQILKPYFKTPSFDIPEALSNEAPGSIVKMEPDDEHSAHTPVEGMSGTSIPGTPGTVEPTTSTDAADQGGEADKEKEKEAQKPRAPKIVRPPGPYDPLLDCGQKRDVTLLLSQMLQCLCMEIPAAMVWNCHKVKQDHDPYMIQQLVGSPLDPLPCKISELPLPLDLPDPGMIYQMLEDLHDDIVQRSEAARQSWAYNQEYQEDHARLASTALKILGILDKVDVLEPLAVERTAEELFPAKIYDCELEVQLRLKVMVQWAITVEREGTYRSIFVAKMLAHQMELQNNEFFPGRSFEDMFIQVLEIEGPFPRAPNYRQEFGNLMLLFLEMIRFHVFSHDRFLKEQIREERVSYLNPILGRVKYWMYCNPMHESYYPQPAKEPVKTELCQFPTSKPCKRMFVEEPDMALLDRLMIQVPLPPMEEFSAERNQRAIFLCGLDEEREKAKEYLRSVLTHIAKIWNRKACALIPNVQDGRYYHQDSIIYKSPRSSFEEILEKFYQLTYHDQVLVAQMSAELFLDQLREFIRCDGGEIAIQEAVDVICSLFETSQYIFGILEFLLKMIPLLQQVEGVVYRSTVDVIPGAVSCQLANVCVGYLAKHWNYFIHCPEASQIINGLYFMIEREIRARDYPITGFARAIAVFIHHAAEQMMKSEMISLEEYSGRHADFGHIFFHGHGITSHSVRYDENFFSDLFAMDNLYEQQFLFISYHEYKKRMHLFDNASNRYSFVVNAIKTAVELGMEHTMLNHLACMCATFTAQKPILADDWLAAARALCCSSASSHHGYGDLLMSLDITNCSIHYPIATFFTLLAAKYAFSVPRLIAEMLHQVYPAALKKDLDRNRDHESEPGLCLALLLMAQLTCANDEPLKYSRHYNGDIGNDKLYKSSSETNYLHMIHRTEMVTVLFPMLANICIMVDTLRGRLKDEKLELIEAENSPYRPQYLITIIRKIQTIICEQEWVTDTMFKVVSSKGMDAFNSDRLKQNCLGQQLLRIGLRRSHERHVVEQLSSCNGNSKKALIDKLLQTLNFWNFRATYYDLGLMIKEISPEVIPKHGPPPPPAADALLEEIAKCCRDLFLVNYKQGIPCPVAQPVEEFRLCDLTNFWLLPSLVAYCPKPSSISASTSTSRVTTKFLKEAAAMIHTEPPTHQKGEKPEPVKPEIQREKHMQSLWLLCQQPFIQMIATCLEVDGKKHKEHFIVALHKQMNDQLKKVQENPSLAYSGKFENERKGVLLRLHLVGKLFKHICTQTQAEPWSGLLFNLMVFRIVKPDSEVFLWETVYDMVGSMLIWGLIDPKGIQTLGYAPMQEWPENRYRYKTYLSMFKGIKKILGGPVPLKTYHHYGNESRRFTDTVVQKQLNAFLAFPKHSLNQTMVDFWGLNPGSKKMKSVPNAFVPTTQAQIHTDKRRGKYSTLIGSYFVATRRVRSNIYDYTPYFVHETRGWTYEKLGHSRSDYMPRFVQEFIQIMTPHRHQTDFFRPNYMPSDSDPTADTFLNSPAVEITDEPMPSPTKPGQKAAEAKKQQQKKDKEKEDQEKEKEAKEKEKLMSPPSATSAQESPKPAAPVAEAPDVKPLTKATGAGRGRRKSTQGTGRTGQGRQKKTAAAVVTPTTPTNPPPSTTPSATAQIPPASQPSGPSQYYQQQQANWQAPPGYPVTTTGQMGTNEETRSRLQHMIKAKSENATNAQGFGGGSGCDGSPKEISALQTALLSPDPSSVSPYERQTEERYQRDDDSSSEPTNIPAAGVLAAQQQQQQSMSTSSGYSAAQQRTGFPDHTSNERHREYYMQQQQQHGAGRY
ncbi:unnamed protein product, partial [Mesorhabditis spiculigera]